MSTNWYKKISSSKRPLSAIEMVGQKSAAFIQTGIGKIATYQQRVDSIKLPIIFLHGVYFDHHLWDKAIEPVNDRNVITIDMPMHGLSKELTKQHWTLDDCAQMLLEILDCLQMEKVVAVGHSWGSMTILRAMSKQPERFESVLLCNMPFLAATRMEKIKFRLQHSMLFFRNFYAHQTARAIFGKSSLRESPSLIDELKRPMGLLTNREIIQTDRTVLINASDASDWIRNLKVRTLALKGEEDYVPNPPAVDTFIVKGGHISPLEQPQEIWRILQKLAH